MILEIVRNTRVKSISHRLIWQLVLTFSSSRYASHFLSSSPNTFPFLFLLINIIWQGELWYQHKSKKEIWRRNSFSVSSVIGDQWDCRQWHSSNPHSAPNAQRWSRFTLAAFLDMCFNIICLLVEKHLYWFFMLLSFPFWFSFTSKIDQFPGALWRLKHPLSLCRREKPLRLGKFHKTWNKTLFVPCIGSGGGGASTSVHGSHRIPPKNWHLWRQLLKNGILADYLSFGSRYAHASWRKCGKAWWSTKFQTGESFYWRSTF